MFGLADNSNIGFDGKFTSDARISEVEKAKASVANYFVEDGSQVSDHIITEARTFTVTGEVGEVKYHRNLTNNPMSKIFKSLGNIGIFLSPKTTSQIAKVSSVISTSENTISQIESLTQGVKYDLTVIGNDVLKSIFNLGGISKTSEQANFLKFVREYHQKKKLMKLETVRFGVVENLAIINYSVTVNDDNFLTYAIDFQEIRFVQTKTTPANKTAKAPTGKQAKTQTAKKVDKGVVHGKDIAKTDPVKNTTTIEKATKKSLLSKVFS